MSAYRLNGLRKTDGALSFLCCHAVRRMTPLTLHQPGRQFWFGSSQITGSEVIVFNFDRDVNKVRGVKASKSRPETCKATDPSSSGRMQK